MLGAAACTCKEEWLIEGKPSCEQQTDKPMPQTIV
jgi:hypothetical protein